jgi:hypothetical protein
VRGGIDARGAEAAAVIGESIEQLDYVAASRALVRLKRELGIVE